MHHHHNAHHDYKPPPGELHSAIIVIVVSALIIIAILGIIPIWIIYGGFDAVLWMWAIAILVRFIAAPLVRISDGLDMHEIAHMIHRVLR